MAQRGKEPLKGWWSLPGGALEMGERWRTASGAKCAKKPAWKSGRWACFEIFERIMRDAAGAPEYHYVLIDYVCRVTGGALRAGRRRLRGGMGAAAATCPSCKSPKARWP